MGGVESRRLEVLRADADRNEAPYCGVTPRGSIACGRMT